MSDTYDIESEIEVEEDLVSNITDEINFVETDAEVINADLISKFEEFLGETLAKGDERRIFLQGIAYVLADQLHHINETGRSNLLRYAVGAELDSLGELFHNSRLDGKYATVTLAFSLSDVTDVDVTVPKGTVVTPDGYLFFETDEEITFEAKTEETQLSVTATATAIGSDHNDFPIGSINILVDPLPYIASVENITVSGGGSDKETDEEYRGRLRESPFSFSVAGPANAYRAIAMGASVDVADVSVYSPSAGVVEIAVVKDGGVAPDENDEVLSIIHAACDAKNVRPLTDKVQVVPATGVTTDIAVTYFVANGDVSAMGAIESAVDDYIAWQTEKIGRDINPDKLNTLMFSAGAARVVITEPEYRELAENEIAQIGAVTVTYGGSIKL